MKHSMHAQCYRVKRPKGVNETYLYVFAILVVTGYNTKTEKRIIVMVLTDAIIEVTSRFSNVKTICIICS